jgi:PEP-CTERM motif
MIRARITAVMFAATLACASLPARAGQVFVSVNNFTIVSFDNSINNPPPTLFATTNGIGTPGSLAFDGHGNLFAAINGNTIEKYTPGGVGSVFATVANGLTGLTFDSAGNLYAGLANSATIMKYTPLGMGSVYASGDELRHGITNLAFDSSGNLYVGLQNTGVIEKITPGGVKSEFGSVPGAAAGLAFDASGNLFVSNGSLIEKFTPGGVGSVFASGLFLTGPLAFDASGTLFATNGFAQVEEFTPRGVASILGTTAAEPLGLAVQPQGAVPEPSSAVLWALALGAIGLVHDVRRPLSLAIKAIR